MKMTIGIRGVALALLLTTLAGAGVVISPTVSGATSSSSTPKFGTLPSPCGFSVSGVCDRQPSSAKPSVLGIGLALSRNITIFDRR